MVRQREFLLFAQVHLSNILDAKAKRDRRIERFGTEMYHITMGVYYKWDKNGKELSEI